MEFNAIARNWLAIHGNFNDLNTDSVLPDMVHDKNNFCFYAAGFIPDAASELNSYEYFDLLVNFLAGRGSESNAKVLTEFLCLEKKSVTFGALMLHSSTDSATQNIVIELLKDYFFNFNNKLIPMNTKTGKITYINVFQYIQYCQMQKVKLSLAKLIDMNLITYQICNSAKSSYVLGNTLYSSLKKNEFIVLLKRIYTCILNLCSSEFLKHLSEYPCFVLTEAGSNNYSKKSIDQYLLSIAKAKALGMTLSQLLQFFGVKIIDAWHSIEHFGSLVAFVDDDSYLQVDNTGAIMRKNVFESMPHSTDQVSLNFDFDSYKAFASSRSSKESSTKIPERMNC